MTAAMAFSSSRRRTSGSGRSIIRKPIEIKTITGIWIWLGHYDYWDCQTCNFCHYSHSLSIAEDKRRR
ncbi:hypothetical protein WG66_003291 [Moniliophthora roreri]|nr:hypothetical protein WG66_003291 [Moniliophthora roreri]KAI3614808.1 hypothetical protein WG66_003291 [Moniliophthora roreri]